LDCSEIVNFNYTDKIQVWHNDKCCFQVPIDLGWDIKDTKELVIGDDTWDEGPDCGLCNNGCAARYRCYIHEEPIERCHWKETPLQMIVNGEERTVVNLILQAPYGLWRNEILIFLNTATNNFLEGLNFNYSCKPTNTPKCRRDYKMLDAVILNPLPEMVSCTTLIQIPFIITTGGLPYCSPIKITEDLETGGFDFQASSRSEEGIIKVLDDTNLIFYITLSKGSYRFFKNVISINCLDQSNGIYRECG
jgi:hypothetical protein